MISFTTAQLAKLLEGTLIGGDASFSSVSTDTRTLTEGDLFISLVGPNFDGHDYLEVAYQNGAVAALVQRETKCGLPCVQVPDTLLALGQLANAWRKAGQASVVAVTGSNGKTTVKEMIASILSQKDSVLATSGNLNNHIGLPLTLTKLQDEAYAVVEMGANSPGEIGYLSTTAEPDVAVLINAGRAHLEGFKTLEGVARAKGEIVLGLKPDGLFVLNADDPWAWLWRGLARDHRTVSFGIHKQADYFSPELKEANGHNGNGFFSRFPVFTPEGEFEVELGLAGIHNRMNALAAIAATHQLGATTDQIQKGLALVRSISGRLQSITGKNGVRLIDDSYNANPDSVGAAIKVLARASGRRFLVLGELAELGFGAEGAYQRLGKEARAAGIDHLYSVGSAGLAAESFGQGGCRFDTQKELIESLMSELQAGDQVLVKGSRTAGMEKVVDALAVDGEV